MNRPLPPAGHSNSRRIALAGVTAGLGSALVPSIAASASTEDAIDPAELDPVIAGVLASPTTETYAQTQADYVTRSDMPKNILAPEFGVTTGTTISQTAAIRAAPDANPGAEFFFPAGNYRLDSTLAITKGNSLHLAAGARIYAAAPMDKLIDYTNGQESIRFWDDDKGIYGRGLLDGCRLAKDVLSVGSTLRFTIGGGLSIKDPVERGLVTGKFGAETTVRNVRIYNSSPANVANSIGIDSYMGDSTFSDIVVRDFTVGAREQAANAWSEFHPWIGINDQIVARYPDSVGFWTRGSRPSLTNGYMDTFRTQVKVGRAADDSDIGQALVFNLRTLTGANDVSRPVQQANPGTIFDVGTGCIVDSYFGLYNSTADIPMSFVTGDTSKMTVVGATPPASTTDYHDFEKGTVIGNSTWTPRLAGGGVEGVHTYDWQRGQMSVSREGVVTWSFQIRATLDSTLSGLLRLVDIPFPKGARNLRIYPMGPIVYSTENVAATSIYASIWAPGTTGIGVVRSGFTDTNAANLRGQFVGIYGTLSASYDTLTR